mgnify:CR=1 FL=1
MLRSALVRVFSLFVALALPALALAENGKPLRIGITLHPYYLSLIHI